MGYSARQCAHNLAQQWQPCTHGHPASTGVGRAGITTKRRYRSLAKRYHPDHGGDQRQMQRIIAAYELLKD
jgi:hypothetical protein